jgi:hypothetical protein
MKHLSNRLKAGAVIFAIVLVFFTNYKDAKATTLFIDYYWFYDEPATDFTGIDNTKPYMENLTGCTGFMAVCLYGYQAEDFNTYGVPSSGLKSNHGVPVIIREI